VVIDIGVSAVEMVCLSDSGLRIERLEGECWEKAVRQMGRGAEKRLLQASYIIQPPHDGFAPRDLKIRPRTAAIHAAGRWLADRHRLERIISVEVGRGFAAAVRGEANETPNAIVIDGRTEDVTAGSLGLLVEWIRAEDEGPASFELVVGGEMGPVLAASIAEAVRASRVWIPEMAGSMASIGAVLSPTPIQVEMAAGDVSLEAGVIRGLRNEAMEALSDELSRAGLDFDDVICEVQVAVGRAGEAVAHWLNVAAAGTVDAPSASANRIRAVRAVARVDTRQWEVFGSAEVVESPEFIRREIGSNLTRSLTARDSLAVGEMARGPIAIRESTHVIVVPEGWVVRRERAGGTQLFRDLQREAAMR